MKLFGTICAVAILSCAAAYGQKPPVMPVSPEQLVKVMPGTLKGWVIAEATAQNRFMKWIQTRATRVYQRRKGEAKARITITDTGRYPSSLVRFRDFKPGKANGVEKKMIRGNPALVRDIPERGKQVQILVHDRFIVELLVPPNYEEDMKRWIRSIDWAQPPDLRCPNR